jgi:RNA polymerase sigma-70 factor (ECF subfamily)
MDFALRYPACMDGEADFEKLTASRWDVDSGDVARFKAGDEDAFESLVTRREREVYQVALRMLGAPDDAQEAVQDTFLRAFRSLKAFREDATFRTWILGIAINVCRTRLGSAAERDRRKTASLTVAEPEEIHPREIPLPDRSPSPESMALGGELRAAIHAALLSLPPDHREVLVLREIQELEYEDLAKALSCPIGTVKSRLCRARQALREALEGIWP